MKPLAATLHRLLQRAGYDLVPFPPVDSLGAHLRALFVDLDINCVLDVGAHRGEYGRLLRQIGYRGRIVSFEPVAASFAVLQRRAAADADWAAWPVALGARDGSRSMHMTRGTAFSSFFAPTRDATQRFGAEVAVERVEPVAVRRLQDLFERCVEGLRAPRVFLKLDTQGADLEVVEGAGARLTEVLALQCELAVRPLYEGVDRYVQTVEWLRGLGFELTGIFAVSRDRDLRLLEVDCVLRRAAP